MIELLGYHDGDQGPVYGFRLKDAGVLRDTSTVAVEWKIEDEDGNLLATRPGVLKTPKSGGEVQLFFKGSEGDRGGAGRNLILKPKIYYAMEMDGITPATNLLVNPSFDAATGTNPARLPDSWTLVGVRTAVWDNYANDSAPPSIFGTFQLVNHPTLSDPDYIQQAPSVTLAAGDTISVGCWHRLHGSPGDAAGGVKNNNHGIFFRCGVQANTVAQFEIGTQDWYFVTGSVVTPTAESQVTFGIDGRGTISSNRYDEASAFKGIWDVFHSPDDGFRIPVHPRSRPPKVGGNLVALFGSFEQDSDGDGFPDGLLRIDATNTYSIEKDPTHVAHGAASLKVVLNDATGRSFSLQQRGDYKAGTWRAAVKTKTSGALGAGAGTGGFGIFLRSDYFDHTFPESATTAFGTNDATFTVYSVDLTTTSDHDSMIIDIKLNGKTGTMYLDDVSLTRV